MNTFFNMKDVNFPTIEITRILMVVAPVSPPPSSAHFTTYDPTLPYHTIPYHNDFLCYNIHKRPTAIVLQYSSPHSLSEHYET